METFTVKASDSDKGLRLDKVLATQAPQYSRSRLQQLIEGGNLLLNGEKFDNSAYKVKPGDVFEITVPPSVEALPRPQKIDLEVVYEDKDVVVINKAAGMVVHPGAGNHDGTLVNALLAYCGDELSGIGGVKRPGIVHRLDKETSGLLIVAKNDAAHKGLTEQLSSRKLKRLYQAIVWGNMSPVSGRIETQLARSREDRQKIAVVLEGGREAITDYQMLEAYGLYASLVECRLQTGRTHQIRVHMAHIKHWLVGDPTYGKHAIPRFVKLHKVPEKTAEAMMRFPRQALHAAQLEFIHPISENKISLKAELPEDMKNLLKLLRKS